MFAVIVPCVTSLAVTVAAPAVLSVTLKDFVPATKAALAGSVAFASLDVMLTVSLVLTTFQFASTELTVTLKAVPAVCAEGVPALPATVPGAAVSPGIRICILVWPPGLIVMEGLVFAVLVPSLMSVAVTVAVPAVLSVTAKVFVPATNTALAGKVALASEQVIPTVCVLLTRFQLASTALTVML